jgi:hypothetical protein
MSFDYSNGCKAYAAWQDAEKRALAAQADADQAFVELLAVVKAAVKAKESQREIGEGIGVSAPTVGHYILTYRAVDKFAPAPEEIRPIRAAIVLALKRDDVSAASIRLLIAESKDLKAFLAALKRPTVTKAVADKPAEVLVATAAATALKALDAGVANETAFLTALAELTRIVNALRYEHAMDEENEESPAESVSVSV